MNLQQLITALAAAATAPAEPPSFECNETLHVPPGVAVTLAGPATLACANVSTLLNVSAEATVHLVDLALTGCDRAVLAGPGSVVAFHGSNLTHNSALDAADGAAIYSDGALLLLNRSLVLNNTARQGAVYAAGGSVHIADSTLARNTATRSGGALYATDGCAVTVEHSTFSDNSAVLHGGAVAVAAAVRLSAAESSFTGNTAQEGNGGALHASQASLNLSHVQVTSNAAAAPSNTYHRMGSSRGGGVYAIASAVRVADSSFSDNSAGGSGGAVFALASSVALERSAVTDNAAQRGGGVFVGGDVATRGLVTLDATSLARNAATLSGGGIEIYWRSQLTAANGTAVENNTAGTDGGGVSSFYRCDLLVASSTVSGNVAARDGGGIWAEYGSTVLHATVVAGNAATSGDGGGAWSGGDISYQDALTVGGGTVFRDNAAAGTGSALRSGSSLVARHALIEVRSAAVVAGTLVSAAGPVAMDDCRFSVENLVGAVAIQSTAPPRLRFTDLGNLTTTPQPVACAAVSFGGIVPPFSASTAAVAVPAPAAPLCPFGALCIDRASLVGGIACQCSDPAPGRDPLDDDACRPTEPPSPVPTTRPTPGVRGGGDSARSGNSPGSNGPRAADFDGKSTASVASMALAGFVLFACCFLCPWKRWRTRFNAKVRRAYVELALRDHVQAQEIEIADKLKARRDARKEAGLSPAERARQRERERRAASGAATVVRKPTRKGAATASSSDHYALGKKLIAAGHYAQAIEMLESQRRLAPDDVDLAYMLGRGYEKAGGRAEAARDCFAFVVSAAPDDVAALVKHGNALEECGDSLGAYEQYHEALEVEPACAAALQALGAACVATGKLDEAVEVLADVLKTSPGDADAMFHLGRAYHKKRQFRYAAKCFQQCLRAAPRDADAIRGLAMCYEHSGNADKAVHLWIALLEDDPDDYDASRRLGILYAQRSDPRGLPLIERYLRKDGGDVKALFHAALLYRVGGRSKDAQRACQAAVSKDPRNCPVLAVFCEVLIERGKHRDARRVALKLRKYAPAEPLGTVLLARSTRLALPDDEHGRPDARYAADAAAGSAKACVDALEASGADPAVLEEYATSLEACGELLHASKRFREASEMFANAPASTAMARGTTRAENATRCGAAADRCGAAGAEAAVDAAAAARAARIAGRQEAAAAKAAQRRSATPTPGAATTDAAGAAQGRSGTPAPESPAAAAQGRSATPAPESQAAAAQGRSATPAPESPVGDPVGSPGSPAPPDDEAEARKRALFECVYYRKAKSAMKSEDAASRPKRRVFVEAPQDAEAGYASPAPASSSDDEAESDGDGDGDDGMFSALFRSMEASPAVVVRQPEPDAVAEPARVLSMAIPIEEVPLPALDRWLATADDSQTEDEYSSSGDEDDSSSGGTATTFFDTDDEGGGLRYDSSDVEDEADAMLGLGGAEETKASASEDVEAESVAGSEDALL